MLILFSGTAPQKSADLDYNYTLDKNFHYLTGLDKAGGVLLLAKTGSQVTETLFIESSTPLIEKWAGPLMPPAQAAAISGIAAVEYADDFQAFLTQLLHDHDIQSIALDLDRLKWDA